MKHVHEKGHGLRVHDALDAATSKREALMMGLRLTEGISREDWREKFSEDIADFLPAEKTGRLRDEGYLAENEKTLRATAAGLQRLNAVLGYLLN